MTSGFGQFFAIVNSIRRRYYRGMKTTLLGHTHFSPSTSTAGVLWTPEVCDLCGARCTGPNAVHFATRGHKVDTLATLVHEDLPSEELTYSDTLGQCVCESCYK